jgi:hypothetical protein
MVPLRDFEGLAAELIANDAVAKARRAWYPSRYDCNLHSPLRHSGGSRRRPTFVIPAPG